MPLMFDNSTEVTQIQLDFLQYNSFYTVSHQQCAVTMCTMKKYKKHLKYIII